MQRFLSECILVMIKKIHPLSENLNRLRPYDLKKSTNENITFKEKEKREQMVEENLRNTGFPVKYDKALVIDPLYCGFKYSYRKIL